MKMALVLSAAQMRAVDAGLVARTGLPSLILMENAGRGVAEEILRRRPGLRAGGRAVCVAAGPGNNGGDGFVIARHLATAGVTVRVALAAARAKLTGDAAAMLRALDALDAVGVTDLSSAGRADWDEALAGAAVLVDALLGTGVRDDVGGTLAVAIAAINSCGPAPSPASAAAPASAPMIVAVDIPSGLDADTGRPHGQSVRAELTVTMAARKLGLAVTSDAGAGEVVVVGLGAPIEAPTDLGPVAYWIDEGDVRAVLPSRPALAYKGTGGHAVVIAGSAGKTGAAFLAARAASRAGAGMVTVLSTGAAQAALDAKVVEAMTAAFTAGDDADEGSFAAVEAALARPNVRAVAIGPGIPVGPGMRALVARLAREVALPMVLDADALNLLGASAAESLAAAPAARVLTPHPGEMARLIGRPVADVQADRPGVARALAAATRAIVVLKGPRTLIADPDGTLYVNPAVEPALATAGSGDVLTGVITALLSQGMAPLAAAWAGVFLHGRAGAYAATMHGAPGVIADDLPDAVAAVRASWSAADARAGEGP